MSLTITATCDSLTSDMADVGSVLREHVESSLNKLYKHYLVIYPNKCVPTLRLRRAIAVSTPSVTCMSAASTKLELFIMSIICFADEHAGENQQPAGQGGARQQTADCQGADRQDIHTDWGGDWIDKCIYGNAVLQSGKQPAERAARSASCCALDAQIFFCLQAQLKPNTVAKLRAVVPGIGDADIELMKKVPFRSYDPTIVTEPLIYRMQEVSFAALSGTGLMFENEDLK